MSSKIYDVTLEIKEGMITYPGDPQVEISDICSIEKGDICNVSQLSFGSHIGTHIDAPKHFCESGKTIAELPLEHFLGRVKVFEILNRDVITKDDLIDLDIKRGDIIFLKTENSRLLTEKNFNTAFTYLSPGAAQYLADVGIKTLGFDYLSVEEYGSSKADTHKTLLEKEIVIIEGLLLKDVKEGEYCFSALPLKIKGGNGSPARVVLIEYI